MGSVSVCFNDLDFETSVGEGDGEVVVSVQLSALFAEDIWIPFSVTAGTATPVTDYTTVTSSPMLLRSGATQVDIHITINPDTLDEEDETFFISLGDPTNASRCADIYKVMINDDDAPPTVSFVAAGQSINEPADGSSTTVYITAALSEVSGRNVSVPFSADPAFTTAAVGADYVFDTTSPLVIPAGALTNNIAVRILGDVTDEEDEMIKVVMGVPVNATPLPPTEDTVVILDDDLPPFVSFTWDRQEVGEDVGNVGIQVQLSAVSGKVITVPYNLAASPTVNDGQQDYTIQASPLVISPGLTTTDIPVRIFSDSLDEPDEAITVTMTTPSNAFLGSPSEHTLVIKTDIISPTVSFDPGFRDVPEIPGTVTVLVELSGAYYLPVTVPFTLEGTAQLGVDYLITPSPVVIPAGSASASIDITIMSDMINEIDEEIKLLMGTPTNALPEDPSVHITRILDDDLLPFVYFTEAAQSFNEAAGFRTVTVRLSNITGVDVMVPFTVSGSATQGSDYSLSPSAMVTIPAGFQEQTIQINVSNDDAPNGANVGEPDETIVLTMGTPIGNTAIPQGITTHTATITAWDCPTAPNAPYFDSGESKRLNWPINFSGTRTLDLTQVTISWPTLGGIKMETISFGSPLWNGSDNSGNLSVNTPSPLWSGTFTSQQMVFLFSKTPGTGSISVSARFEHCPVISRSISN
jgi:hypothetical protein